jgi:hypothetical protein
MWYCPDQCRGCSETQCHAASSREYERMRPRNHASVSLVWCRRQTNGRRPVVALGQGPLRPVLHFDPTATVVRLPDLCLHGVRYRLPTHRFRAGKHDSRESLGCALADLPAAAFLRRWDLPQPLIARKRRFPWKGVAADSVRSLHWPANVAAVAASPLTPGRATPASAIASAMAVATGRPIGVSVAGNVSGDCMTTPTMSSPWIAIQ